MANVNLIPTQTRTALGNKWTLATNALADDTKYAFRASGGIVGDYLVLENFTAGLPQDITIEGISVTLKACTGSSGANAHLGAFMSITGKTGNALNITLTQYASSLTTTETTYTLGGSSYLWGYNWRRPQIHGNPAFSLFIFADGNLNVSRKVQYVYITVYYSLNTYLKGERSAFPIDVSLWPYGGPSDSIPVKYNGSGSSNQIRSEDVNLLGDCIYKLQYTSLASSNLIRGEGGEGTDLSPQSLFAWSTTVTGMWDGTGDSVYFHNTQRLNGQTRASISNQTTTNMTSVRWTKPPLLPFNLYMGVFMPLVQGCAWLDENGTITPAHISSTIACFRRIFEPAGPRGEQMDVMSTSIGFRLILGNATSSAERSVSDWAGTHYGYSFQQWTSYGASTKVIVKLSGFAPVGA